MQKLKPQTSTKMITGLHGELDIDLEARGYVGELLLHAVFSRTRDIIYGNEFIVCKFKKLQENNLFLNVWVNTHIQLYEGL